MRFGHGNRAIAPRGSGMGFEFHWLDRTASKPLVIDSFRTTYGISL